MTGDVRAIRQAAEFLEALETEMRDEMRLVGHARTSSGQHPTDRSLCRACRLEVQADRAWDHARKLRAALS